MPPQEPSQARGRSLEAENELREFLKLARPEWSFPRRSGRSDIARVMSKLRAINITDVETLVRRIDENTINSDLLAADRRPPLSREAIDAIKRRRPFMQVLETTDVPLVRQVGPLAPVTRIFAKKSFAGTVRAMRSNSAPTCSMAHSAAAAPRSRPATQGGHSCHAASMLQSDMSLVSAGGGHAGRARLRGARPRKRRQVADSSLGPTHTVSRHGEVERVPAPENSARASAAPSEASGVNSPAYGEEQPMRSNRSMRAPSWQATEQPATAPGTPDGRPMRRAVSAESLADSPSYEDVERLHGLSVEMARPKAGRGLAHWTCLRHKTPLQQAEEMLREQDALDHRKELIRTVALQDLDMPFRSHVARNISLRLKEEQRHDEQVGGLAMQQQCQNIRKQINMMVNSRRELAGLRTRWQAVADVADGDDATSPAAGHKFPA